MTGGKTGETNRTRKMAMVNMDVAVKRIKLLKGKDLTLFMTLAFVEELMGAPMLFLSENNKGLYEVINLRSIIVLEIRSMFAILEIKNLEDETSPVKSFLSVQSHRGNQIIERRFPSSFCYFSLIPKNLSLGLFCFS